MGFFGDLIEPDDATASSDLEVSSIEVVQPEPETVSIEEISVTPALDDIEITNIEEVSTSPVNTAPRVPLAISGRPVGAGLRNRFKGHAEMNDLVREDWIKSIKLDPDAFDALLYRAISPSEIAIDDDGYEVSAAHRLDPNQETLEYEDPVLVVVLDAPDEMADFYAMNDGDENAGVSDDALILSIAEFGVPLGSILEWSEDLSDNQTIRRWWYVHRKFNYGTASVGTLYYCVPCRSYEGLFNGEE